MDLLAFLDGILAAIFEAFEDRDLALFLATGIILVGSLFWLWFEQKMFRLGKSLTKGHVIIETGTPDDLNTLPLDQQKRALEAAFAEHFDVEETGIHQQLSNEPLLKHVWSEYGETFVHQGDNGDDLVIRNTLRPDQYFNLSSVVHGFLDLGFWRALPNWFVGVGLILTFIGLAAALSTASQNLATDAQGALTNLLNIATVKFTTSVAGLLCSLLLSIRIRVGENTIARRTASLCHSIERRLRVITQEDMAYRQLQEMRAQTRQLEDFNQTFAIQLADALEAKFSQSVGSVFKEALAPLNETVDRITKSASSSNQEAMREMLDDMKESIQKGAGDEMRAVVATLGEMQGALGSVTEGLSKSGNNFGSRLDSAVERIERSMQASQTALEANVAKTQEQFDTVMSRISTQLGDELSKVSGGMGEAAERAGQTFEHSIGRVAGQLSDAFDPMANSIKSAAESAGETIENTLVKAVGRLDEAISPMSQGLQDLGGTLRGLDGRLQSQSEHIGSVSEEILGLTTGLQRVISQLQEAGYPLTQSAEKFEVAANRIDQAATSISTTHEALSELSETISETAEDSQESWSSYQDRFAAVDESLANAFTKIVEGTTDHAEHVSKFVQELDKSMSQAASSLAGGIEDLQGAIEELSETLPNSRAAE